MIKQPAQNNQTTSKNDPGKTPAIIGLVLAFVGAGLIGLILSIIGYKKSKSVGIKNRIALTGIIINAISLILFPILIFGPAFIAINTESKTEKSNNLAVDIYLVAEDYYKKVHSYPKTKDDLISATPVILSPSGKSLTLPSGIVFDSLLKAPAPDNASLYTRYQTCDSGDGYNVAYWDYATNKITASPITAGSQTNCVTVSN